VRGVGSSNLPVPTITSFIFNNLQASLIAASSFHFANCAVIATLSKVATAFRLALLDQKAASLRDCETALFPFSFARPGLRAHSRPQDLLSAKRAATVFCLPVVWPFAARS
jgi:hypothetical protein